MGATIGRLAVDPAHCQARPRTPSGKSGRLLPGTVNAYL